MRGGLQLTAHKHRSAAHAIVKLAAPEAVVMPLDQHAGFSLTPCVSSGESVLAGQIIARSDENWAANLHAPISGNVIAVEPRPSALSHGGLSPAIVIHRDGSKRDSSGAAIASDWRNLSPAELCARIAAGGIVGLGGARFSTAKKLSSAPSFDCLILNGVECEPYISCDDRLMRERAAEIVLGAQIMMRACSAKRCLIAVEGDKPEALHSMEEAAAATGDAAVQVRAVEVFYPTGDEGQLIRILLGLEIPRGGLPADLNVLCQNVGTAAAVARCVAQGEPLISRIVTVTGSGVVRPGNLEVLLGTPIAALIEACGGYTPQATTLIMGGSMMGAALPDDELPVVKSTHCVIAASTAEIHSQTFEQTCIRCGACMDACPAGLLPQQLHAHLLNNNFVAVAELGLADCIECGCCDYVCPSNIPLVSRFRTAKRARA